MTPDLVVVIPGIMGSELVDRDGKVLWGFSPSLLFRRRGLRKAIERLSVGTVDGARATRVLTVPGWLPMLDGIEPYSDLVDELKALVLRPQALRTFPYDWRLSIEHNAGLLQVAVEEYHRQWTATVAGLPSGERAGVEPMVTFVCHSMGGLVARYFVDLLDKKGLTRRIITLGTPRLGGLKAVRLLAAGDIARFGLLAEPLRDAARTMPGVYDLLPRFKCLLTGGTLGRPSAEDFVGVGASRALIDDATTRFDAMTAAAPKCEVRAMVGTMQRTLSQFSVASGVAQFVEAEAGGDGTVHVSSALPAAGPPGGYLPQKHGRLARTEEAVKFVRAVLEEDEFRQLQAVDGPGLVVPAAAVAKVPFEVEVTSWAGGSSIVIEDAETNRSLDRLTPVKLDGRRVASYTASEPGLYRVKLTAGSYGDVTELVGVIAPEDATGD